MFGVPQVSQQMVHIAGVLEIQRVALWVPFACVSVRKLVHGKEDGLAHMAAHRKYTVRHHAWQPLALHVQLFR